MIFFGNRRRTMIAAVIVLGGATAAAAFVVHDPASNAQNISLHGLLRTLERQLHNTHMAKVTDQIERAREQVTLASDQLKATLNWQQYMEVIHGAWRERLGMLADHRATLISTAPIDIRSLGWGSLDEFRELPQTQTAATALDQLRAVLDANSGAGLAGVRADLETVWGDVPVTTNGVAVEAAHREMGAASVFVGELTQAIREKQQNMTQLKEEINSGDLPPGDLERKMIILAAEQVDVDLMTAQTINQSNRLAVHQLGFQAAGAGNMELGRLKDRANRLQMMGRVTFGLAPPEPPSGVE